MTRRRCDFFSISVLLYSNPYGSRMGFRMGFAWDFTEQQEADHAGQVLPRRASAQTQKLKK